MKRAGFVSLLVLVILMIAGAAFGQTPAESVEMQKWWQNLLVIIISGVFAIVTPVISALVMAAIRKWHLKVEQEQVDWILGKAVGFGEQKLKTLLKDGKPVDGSEIAKAALEEGNKLLQKYGLAKKFGDWLAAGIEAKLGEKVIEAGGARTVVSNGG